MGKGGHGGGEGRQPISAFVDPESTVFNFNFSLVGSGWETSPVQIAA